MSRRRRRREKAEARPEEAGSQGELLDDGEGVGLAGSDDDGAPKGPADFELVEDEEAERPTSPPDATPEVAPAGDPEPPSEADTALARARELVRVGHVEEAMTAYRQMLYGEPGNLKARNNLGVLLDEMGSHELAIEQFEAARDVEPENVEVLVNLAAALTSLRRYEEAERELRRALRVEPESVEVRASLGVLFFHRGLYEQAEEELAWVCARDDAHGAAHFYRGESLSRMGQVDRALEVLIRAVHLQPDNARAYYTMGILYDRKHLSNEAQAMYRKARQLSTP